MSVGDFIYYESVLPKESCDNLIRFFDDNKHLQGLGMMGVNTPIGSLEISLKPKDLSDYFGLGRSVRKCIDSYSKIYPLVNTNVSNWTTFHTCQFAKFEPDKYYSDIHCENSSSEINISTRCFAWMI